MSDLLRSTQWRTFVLFLLLACPAAARAQCPEKTSVTDTLLNADGTLAAGRLVISWPTLQAGACQVIAGQVSVPITNGVLSVDLYPNDASTPDGTSYRVMYYLKSGRVTTEYWVVPTSPVTVSLALVRSSSIPSPNVMLAQGQITNLVSDLARKVELPFLCPIGKLLQSNGSVVQPQVDCVDPGGGSSADHQVNGTSLAAANPVNFQSTSTIDFLNPAAGNIQSVIKNSSITAGLLSVSSPSSAQLSGLGDNNVSPGALSPNRTSGVAEIQANKGVSGGYASLDGSGSVVQNPASAQTGPAANKIPTADGAGKISDGWLSTNVTLLGASVDLNTETTGTLFLTRGGTNQASWTASRCVRTNSSGAALESAAGDCSPTSAPYLLLTADSTLTSERILDARDNLDSADGGAGGALSLDFSPLDPSAVWLSEDFHGGATSSGQIGVYGWLTNSIGGSGTVSRTVAELPHSGIFRFATSSTSGQGTYVSLGGIGFEMLGELGANPNWELLWIFRIPDPTSIRFRIGLADASTGTPLPDDGMWLRYDTSSGFSDTNFQFECRAATVSTVVSSSVAANTNWHKLRIRSASSGTIVFSLDGGVEQAISTNVPAMTVSPVMIVVTDTSSSRSADLDFFAFKMRGLAR